MQPSLRRSSEGPHLQGRRPSAIRSPDSINEYSPRGALACDSPGNNLGCDNGCPWLATGRDREPPGLDALGVEVTFSHTSVTGIFPFPTVDWDETAVMQIEPDTRGAQ